MPVDSSSIFDAARSAGARKVMETTLGTAGLREKGAGILARAVFCARGSNAIFVSDLKTIIDRLAQGDIGEGQARTAIWESLKALGYTPEGGFPDAPPGAVPPAVAGTLQDLSSFRRRDLIVRTQLQLMRGAGEQTRGHTPERLRTHPGWEFIRIEDRDAPRNWEGKAPTRQDPIARWIIAGGEVSEGSKMYALKGDPIWGELGSYDNFDDALGVDFPPFAFNSGMGWSELSASECETLGIAGPAGETPDEWFQSGPVVMAGKLPLPTPQISLKGVDPALIEAFKQATGAKERAGKPLTMDYSDILEESIARRAEIYQKANPDYDPEYGKKP